MYVYERAQCRKYFIAFNFVAFRDYENIAATKISSIYKYSIHNRFYTTLPLIFLMYSMLLSFMRKTN